MKKALLVFLSGVAGLITAFFVITTILDDDDKSWYGPEDTYW